jgi:hypothetical protein
MQRATKTKIFEMETIETIAPVEKPLLTSSQPGGSAHIEHFDGSEHVAIPLDVSHIPASQLAQYVVQAGDTVVSSTSDVKVNVSVELQATSFVASRFGLLPYASLPAAGHVRGDCPVTDESRANRANDDVIIGGIIFLCRRAITMVDLLYLERLK